MTKPQNCIATCGSCGIRDSVLFADLNESDLLPLQDSIDELALEPQQVLYRMGESGKAIYTVRSGLIKLVRYLPDGSQRIVRLVRIHDVMGLEALLSQPYQHEAIVLQPVRLCRIPTQLIQRLDEENPILHRELLHRWQRALAEADAWLTELSTGSARLRVARLLLRLSDENGKGCCALVNRRDMGAMLGITTESASRAIAQFKRAGLLEEGPWGFRADLPHLREIAVD